MPESKGAKRIHFVIHPSSPPTESTVKRVMPTSMSSAQKLLLILILGFAFRSFGLTQHWRTNDHYNFGGPFMQSFVFCLGQTPFSVSKGIPHRNCDAEYDLKNSPVKNELDPELLQKLETTGTTARKGDVVYYRNHPPVPYYILLAMTSVLGHSEWVFRLYTLI